MAQSNTAQQPSPSPRTFGHYAKRVGLFFLIGTILIIPRFRRLRRRIWAWTGIRLAAMACGIGLIRRFEYAQSGTATLGLGLFLLVAALVLRAQPLVKSVDALAQELDALIALNGGTFRQSPGVAPIPKTQIFVHPERIIVLGAQERRLLEIPFAKVMSLAAKPVAQEDGKGNESWEVEVQWADNDPHVTTFRYDGTFAEHLARVTESTVRSQWKKGLPVVQR